MSMREDIAQRMQEAAKEARFDQHQLVAKVLDVSLQEWLAVFAGRQDLTVRAAALFSELTASRIEWLVYGRGSRTADQQQYIQDAVGKITRGVDDTTPGLLKSVVVVDRLRATITAGIQALCELVVSTPDLGVHRLPLPARVGVPRSGQSLRRHTDLREVRLRELREIIAAQTSRCVSFCRTVGAYTLLLQQAERAGLGDDDHLALLLQNKTSSGDEYVLKSALYPAAPAADGPVAGKAA